MEGIVRSWGRILSGYAPSLSIEITRECPLRCPGCYAFGDEHLGGGGITLRDVRDFKGQALIDGILAVVDRHRPMHVSLVGGEPLVRYRELDVILPRLAERGVHVQVVTSAVRHGSRRLGLDSPIDDCRLDRWASTRARRPPGACDLRSHPEAHRRPPGRRALHGDAAAGDASGISSRVHGVLVEAAARAEDLVQPLHAAGRRGVGGEAPARGS